MRNPARMTTALARAHEKAYEIGLVGDMPYADYGRRLYPNVLADLNRHARGGPQHRAVRRVHGLRAGPGRLRLRPRPVRAVRPAGRLQSAAYPENVRWRKGPVTYVGLNVTGSDNNFIDATNTKKDGPIAQAQAEYTAPNAANLQWLKDSFAAAKASGSKGVLLSIQADMWDPSAVRTHFKDTKDELVRQVTGFAGPVVLVNGDSHSFEVDKPLLDAATTNAAGKAGVGNVIQNFTRVTTFGEYQYHWVSATIDPEDPELFSFHQHLVRADVPAYTLP